MLGMFSMSESSNTDCALSVTGPSESTAIVTGPIPRNPKATRPNANTAGAIIRVPKPVVLTRKPMAIRAMIDIPSQYALKLPATNPDRMLSDAPPSRDEVTTSLTCADFTDVKTFTSSGIIAPARVPQVMTAESFHHNDPSPRSGSSRRETRNVSATDASDVSHTDDVSGAS